MQCTILIRPCSVYDTNINVVITDNVANFQFRVTINFYTILFTHLRYFTFTYFTFKYKTMSHEIGKIVFWCNQFYSPETII